MGCITAHNCHIQTPAENGDTKKNHEPYSFITVTKNSDQYKQCKIMATQRSIVARNSKSRSFI